MMKFLRLQKREGDETFWKEKLENKIERLNRVLDILTYLLGPIISVY